MSGEPKQCDVSPNDSTGSRNPNRQGRCSHRRALIGHRVFRSIEHEKNINRVRCLCMWAHRRRNARDNVDSIYIKMRHQFWGDAWFGFGSVTKPTGHAAVLLQCTRKCACEIMLPFSHAIVLSVNIYSHTHTQHMPRQRNSVVSIFCAIRARTQRCRGIKPVMEFTAVWRAHVIMRIPFGFTWAPMLTGH